MYIIFGKMSRGEWKIKKKLLFTRCANGYSTMFKKIWWKSFMKYGILYLLPSLQQKGGEPSGRYRHHVSYLCHSRCVSYYIMQMAGRGE